MAGTAVVGTPWARLASGHQGKPNSLDGLDDYVATAMTRWEVPGLAIAVVQDGQVVHARGYGVRRVGAEARVDAETVFSIASCTKAFTAAALAKLVDEGKLQWDDPLARHLPALQLFDADLTSRVTIRQALAHRTGLPTANMLWRSGAFGSDEIVARLRWLPPVAPPGERFLYNNNLYLVVGKIAEQVSGKTWSEFLRTNLLQPLGMTSTAVDSSEVKGRENVAAPHASDTGRVQPIPPECPDVVAPAGAIHANVLDMAQWLKCHLGNGLCDGRPILSGDRIREMHTAPGRIAAAAPAEPGVPRAPIGNYGLGWFFNDHAGRQVIEHSGTQNGFVSWVAMLPDERLGLVVLANHHRTGLNSALRSWILDAILGRPPRDWSEIVRADYANGYQRLLREARAQFDAQRPAATQPSQPLARYAGRYVSQLYGPILVTVRNDRLRLQFGTRFDGELEHWQTDAFRSTFGNPRLDDWLVTFTLQNGAAAGLHAKESPWAPAWYDDADDLGDFQRA